MVMVGGVMIDADVCDVLFRGGVRFLLGWLNLRRGGETDDDGGDGLLSSITNLSVFFNKDQ
jgi:hypothetical protein